MFYENHSSVLSTLTSLRKLNVAMHRGNSPSFYRPSMLTEYTLLKHFVSRVFRLSNIPMDIVLLSLAYIDQMKLHHMLDYGFYTCEWVFIGGLVLASQFLGNYSFIKEELEGVDLLFDKTDVGAIEMYVLLDFRFEDISITEEALLDLHEALFWVADTEKSCRRARCQTHNHSRAKISMFCPSHKEAHIPATKLCRQTRWCKLLYRLRLTRTCIEGW
ncbi:hypothetical protein J3A83DRAFT_4185055 [Scleroderma citrinum]